MEFIEATHLRGRNPKGFLMGEKLDGVRAEWNGSAFVSKQGKRFAAPDWFTASMPAAGGLDGELTAGRGGFEKTLSAIKNADSLAWREMLYMVFDKPGPAPYASRLHSLDALKLPAHCFRWFSVVCKGRTDLQKSLERVEAKGGEGLILRDPEAPHKPGRSPGFIKVVTRHTAEGELVGKKLSTGANPALVGSLAIEWRGKRFNLRAGLTASLRKNPPKLGQAITFSFYKITAKGRPFSPVFVGVRDYE